MSIITATHASVNPSTPPALPDTLLIEGMRIAREAADYPDECPEEPTWDDLADFHDWQDELSAKDHLDRSATFTLADLVARQAEFYRGWSNAAGDLLAAAMTDLAGKIEATGATTPDEL